MDDHNAPFKQVGSTTIGWMTLCNACYERISPLLTKECIEHINKINRQMLGRVNKRIDAGSAAEEETLLKATFEKFAKLDTDSILSEIEFRDGGLFGECLLAPPSGSTREAIRAQALADRLSAAYRDLSSQSDEEIDEPL